MGKTPLIKGMFISSHIDKLRREKGDAAVAELYKRLGIEKGFNNFEDYPVRQEIEIIETVLELLDGAAPENKEFEAGRLHFKNFSETFFGKMTISIAPRTSEGFKTIMQGVSLIGRYVFKNTNVSSRLIDESVVKVIMDNNDYSIEHFRGFFYEWAVFWGLVQPEVTAEELAEKRYEYTIRWKYEY